MGIAIEADIFKYNKKQEATFQKNFEKMLSVQDVKHGLYFQHKKC